MTEPTGPSARLDDIARTAARLFLDKGYDAASMADLAAATGLGKSSLYHHLDSKDQLLGYICDRAIGELRRGIDEAAANRGGPGDRLAAALEHVARTALADIAATNLVITVKPTSETARRVIDELGQVERSLAELVAAAQADGTARADIEPHLLTRLVLGTVSGAVTWYRPETSDVALETLRSGVVALMLGSLAPVERP